MSRQDRKQKRPQDLPSPRRVGAGQMQGAVAHPGIEQATLLQVLDQKGQLPKRRHRRLRVPFHVHPTPERLNGKTPLRASILNRHGITRGVNRNPLSRCRHSQA